MKRLLLASAVFAVLSMAFTSCEKEEDENLGGNEILIVDDITTATTWTSNNIYVIDGDIDIDANITIEPGTIIKFKTGASLGFGYTSNVTVTANGTADKRIVFTAYGSNPTPGSWDGVFFYNHVLQNSSLTYCDFLYAGYSDWPAVSFRCKLTFNNNIIKYAKLLGIDMDGDGSFVSMNDNTITDCGTHAIALYPSAIHTLGVNNNITCKAGYGIFVNEGEVNSTTGTNLLWRKQPVQYIFDLGSVIETNLTIEAGTTLAFNAGAYLNFGYSANVTLTAVGTATNPITFTSSNTSPAAGAWRGLSLYGYTTPNTQFDYCNFNYGGYDGEQFIYAREVNGFTVKNCSFNNSAGWGIYLDYDAALSGTSSNNTFTNCSLGEIYIYQE